MTQKELEALFKKKYDENERVKNIFEDEAAGRTVYPNSKVNEDALHVYLELREMLLEMQTQGICKFEIDNAAEHYEVHFIHIQWKEETEIEAERLIELLAPVTELSERENHFVFLNDNEWLLNFILYNPS